MLQVPRSTTELECMTTSTQLCGSDEISHSASAGVGRHTANRRRQRAPRKGNTTDLRVMERHFPPTQLHRDLQVLSWQIAICCGM